MPRKWCVTCEGGSYQNSWSDVCKSSCGNDCENRCYNCNNLFSGEAVAPSYKVNTLSKEQIKKIQNHLDTMIEQSGGKNEYEYRIEVKSTTGYTITQSIVGRRR